MSVKRPQKAPSDPISDGQLVHLDYPIVGSPKLDGFRCLVDEIPKTSSLKPWPNEFIMNELSRSEYHGLDGEIIVGEPNDPNVFHNTSGPVRRRDGEPDFKFYVFDRWDAKGYSYEDRWLKQIPINWGRIAVLEQRLLRTPEEVLAYEQEMLHVGYEGVMIRSIDKTYKEGRCSFNDLNIFKRKPYAETDGIIVGFVEGMTNLNVQKENELGYMRRSHHKENKVPRGTLGSFLITFDLWPGKHPVAPGEGYTQELRQQIWDRRDEYLGQVATVKFQKYGSIDAPRQPTVVKVRPSWDVST